MVWYKNICFTCKQDSGDTKIDFLIFQILKRSAKIFKLNVKCNIKKCNSTRYFKIRTLANKFICTVKFHNVISSRNTKNNLKRSCDYYFRWNFSLHCLLHEAVPSSHQSINYLRGIQHLIRTILLEGSGNVSLVKGTTKVCK